MKRAALREAQSSQPPPPLSTRTADGLLVCKVCGSRARSVESALWASHLATKLHKESLAALRELASSSAAAGAGAPPPESVGGEAASSSSSFSSVSSSSLPSPSSSSAPAAPESALPKGFFDDEAADMRARGVDPKRARVEAEEAALGEFMAWTKEVGASEEARAAEDEADYAERARLAAAEDAFYRARVSVLRLARDGKLAEAVAEAGVADPVGADAVSGVGADAGSGAGGAEDARFAGAVSFLTSADPGASRVSSAEIASIVASKARLARAARAAAASLGADAGADNGGDDEDGESIFGWRRKTR